MKNKPAYKRIVLKLSGEALQGSREYGIDPDIIASLARQINDIHKLGLDVAVVVGGGNIYRGMNGEAHGTDRCTGDYMGMLATAVNGLALQGGLEKIGVFTRVLTAIEMKELAEPYIRRRAIRHLEKGRVVIFVGGTGNPYFTTDTTAALRAIEIGADIIFKATKVDGVYSADPAKIKGARKFSRLRYIDVLKKSLRIMDATAISLCMDNNIPILVFNLTRDGNIKKAAMGKRIGTIVKG